MCSSLTLYSSQLDHCIRYKKIICIDSHAQIHILIQLCVYLHTCPYMCWTNTFKRAASVKKDSKQVEAATWFNWKNDSLLHKRKCSSYWVQKIMTHRWGFIWSWSQTPLNTSSGKPISIVTIPDAWLTLTIKARSSSVPNVNSLDPEEAQFLPFLWQRRFVCKIERLSCNTEGFLHLYVRHAFKCARGAL